MDAATRGDMPATGNGDRTDYREVVTEHNGVRVTGARRHTIDLHSLARALLMVCDDLARKENETHTAAGDDGRKVGEESKLDPDGSDAQIED